MLQAGCWTTPSADVQPRGPSRVIQKGIVVKSVMHLAIVQSVEADTRMIVMQIPGTTGTYAYRASPKVSDLNRLAPGSKVRATITEELTVYVSRDGRLPGADTAPPGATQAKVLLVDPSYRLLTLQHPDGQTQTFKVGLKAKLEQIEPGDDVVIQTPEIVSLSVR